MNNLKFRKELEVIRDKFEEMVHLMVKKHER